MSALFRRLLTCIQQTDMYEKKLDSLKYGPLDVPFFWRLIMEFPETWKRNSAHSENKKVLQSEVRMLKESFQVNKMMDFTCTLIRIPGIQTILPSAVPSLNQKTDVTQRGQSIVQLSDICLA